MYESLNNKKKLLFISAFILIFLRILSYAWCSDDAFHIYIMAKNLLTGSGFTPTPGLRVNVATCPLWALIVTFGMLFWNNPYAIGMIFNLLFSGIALFILFKSIYKKENWFLILVVVTTTLCFSKTYLSFTTSGLENALILLLSALYLEVLFKNEYFSKMELFKIALLEGLIAFTRMDCALIFAFTSAYAFLFKYKKDDSDASGFLWKKMVSVIPVALVGLSPFLFWELFSLFYYGSFVPNTALAKLNTGFPLNEYFVRGMWYFILSAVFDVIVLGQIFVILVIWESAKFNRQKYIKERLVLTGTIFYLFYILYIGGDFMLGRHFLSTFWTLILLINKSQIAINFNKHIFIPIILLAAGVFLLNILISSKITIKQHNLSNILISSYQKSGWRGDIQKGRYPFTGLKIVLLNYFKNGDFRSIEACPGIGIQYFLGNEAMYEYRLYDPLLSRLPAIHHDNWGVGFMVRKIPNGYYETLFLHENYIADKNLALYYSKLKFVISGDLFDLKRIKALLVLTMGGYNDKLFQYINDNDLTTPGGSEDLP